MPALMPKSLENTQWCQLSKDKTPHNSLSVSEKIDAINFPLVLHLLIVKRKKKRSAQLNLINLIMYFRNLLQITWGSNLSVHLRQQCTCYYDQKRNNIFMQVQGIEFKIFYIHGYNGTQKYSRQESVYPVQLVYKVSLLTRLRGICISILTLKGSPLQKREQWVCDILPLQNVQMLCEMV